MRSRRQHKRVILGVARSNFMREKRRDWQLQAAAFEPFPDKRQPVPITSMTGCHQIVRPWRLCKSVRAGEESNRRKPTAK
jgi:hypothetical protein